MQRLLASKKQKTIANMGKKFFWDFYLSKFRKLGYNKATPKQIKGGG